MITKLILSLAAILTLVTNAVAATPTMRLDYYHTGDASQEVFSVDRVVIEPLPWPGDPAQAIDSSNLGKYLFEIRDLKTKQLLYSRGFASIYGEWETTDEAKTMKRTFQESLRFPAPAAPVSVVLKKRDAKNVFQDIWTTTIDPADQFVDRSKPTPPAPLITIQKTGEPETRVDFLILGDGYTAAEAKKFEADARRLTEMLFSTSPFKENRKELQRLGTLSTGGRVRRLETFNRHLSRLTDRRNLRCVRIGTIRADFRQSRVAQSGTVCAVRVHRGARQQSDLRRWWNLQSLQHCCC